MGAGTCSPERLQSHPGFLIFIDRSASHVLDETSTPD